MPSKKPVEHSIPASVSERSRRNLNFERRDSKIEGESVDTKALQVHLQGETTGSFLLDTRPWNDNHREPTPAPHRKFQRPAYITGNIWDWSPGGARKRARDPWAQRRCARAVQRNSCFGNEKAIRMVEDARRVSTKRRRIALSEAIISIEQRSGKLRALKAELEAERARLVAVLRSSAV
ncbi:hypothetical protein TWF718_009689 [Orbilia javanica]|uniref:Uncharacterized protein n=1 Tax=Orbilia javanica TaxID=47235 RepID=A0AAN8MZM0_9PEZI